MTIEIMPEKEYFLDGEKQNKELLIKKREEQEWVYYLVIGSFALITLLNFIIPDFHLIRPEPIDIEYGFIGVMLAFFGSVFFLRAFFVNGGSNWFDLYWWLSVILCIVLLYFGLPILFG